MKSLPSMNVVPGATSIRPVGCFSVTEAMHDQEPSAFRRNAFSGLFTGVSTARSGCLPRAGAARQLLEHVGHDPARREIGHFDGSVDSHQDWNCLSPTVATLDVQDRAGARVQCIVQSEIESLGAVEP